MTGNGYKFECMNYNIILKHLVSDERVNEVVVGTKDDISFLHQPSAGIVWASL